MSGMEKPDHRTIGKKLDLFAFSPLVGSGLPLFTPRGTIIREELSDFISELQEKRGYQRVTIPHIAKSDLYKTSGHWEKFREDMFHVRGKRNAEFALKPMNCPHHAEIYAARKRSYRELPIRFAEMSTVYRDEQQGELQGLSRVRSITIDDGHVFCSPEQMPEEMMAIMDMVDEFYKTLNMQLTFRLSLRDPKQPEKYLGTDEIWETSENALRDVLNKKGVAFTEELGEAAFYGPKIDFTAKDSLGRTWQLATLQLDFNIPKRFTLTYTDEDGNAQTPVMIHRAITGSLERFIAILIEHFAGALPLWLSPVQVRVVSVSESANKYADEIKTLLHKEHIRTEVDVRDLTVGKKIREGEEERIPVLAVVGERESKQHTLAVRLHGGKDEGAKPVDEVIASLTKAIQERE